MPDLPEEHLDARKNAIAKLEEIVSKLRDANDLDAVGVVQRAINSVMKEQRVGGRPPMPPATNLTVSTDLPENRRAAREDAISQMRQIASMLSAVGDHAAAGHVYGFIPAVANTVLLDRDKL